MTENQTATPAPAPTLTIAPAMRIEMVHRNEKDEDHDSLEFGPADLRMKIYGNIGKPGVFSDRVDEAIKMMILKAEALEKAGLRSTKKAKGEGAP